jgi:AmmeMemoRadiSam system protein B
MYSGRVAAAAYALVRNRNYEAVVVISPSHTTGFPFASVYDGDGYATPLGATAVDRDLAGELAQAGPEVTLSSRGHSTGFGGRGEHALEVQLPFIQTVLPGVPVVPVVMGAQSEAVTRALAAALTGLGRNRDLLIVASSDLSHFHPEKEAHALDAISIDLVKNRDITGLLDKSRPSDCAPCGAGPIAALLLACAGLGATDIKMVRYATSGDAESGSRESVVGYMSAVVYEE